MNDPRCNAGPACEVEAEPDTHGTQARLQAWRASGAAAVDPVRFRWIEAMARRATAHAGATRRRLDARLLQLLDDYARRIAQAPHHPPAPPDPPIGATRGPLGVLVDDLARHAAATTGDAALPMAASGARSAPGAPVELRTLSRFRSTWVQLSARQRLAQVRAQVPDNAGPLNTQQLVHRSLRLMQAQSGGYLEHFMAHLDALLLLEQALDPPLPVSPGARHDTPRRPTRSR